MFRKGESIKIIFTLSFIAGVLFIGIALAMAQQTQLKGAIIDAPRISPQDTYRQVTSGNAILVCAFENETTCSTMMLEKAITLKEFESRLAGINKNQTIIFYCD
ncbi:MAG: hypothetical protein ACXWL9_10120 [Syntrophales bacterium]